MNSAALFKLLILAHIAALYAWMRFTHWETDANAELIKADGSHDGLHEGFHFQRGALRLLVAVSLTVLGSALLWRNIGLWALAAGGLLCLFSGYFVLYFNPRLNEMTGKPRDYISKEKNAALFDRVLNSLGWRLLPTLRALFVLGAAGYVAAMIIVFRHL